MIDIYVCGSWDGVDENGNPTYGPLFEIENMPEFPNTLEGKEKELEGYLEFIEYHKAIYPCREEVTKKLKEVENYWRETHDRLDKENTLMARIFNHKKIEDLKHENDNAFRMFEYYRSLEKQCSVLEYAEYLRDQTIEEIEKMSK